MPRDFKTTPTVNTKSVAVREDVAIDVTFMQAGVLTTGTGVFRWYNDTGVTLTIVSIRASVTTVPTGSTILVDVNKNGTTVFTTQGNRPAIAISGNTDKKTNMDVTTVADGDYLTADIDQIGSTIAGSNLTVVVQLRKS